MSTINLAKKLLNWNSKHLTHKSELSKANIAELFAPSFKVKANGREYDANYENYLTFLNQFRSTIESIQYDVEDIIYDENSAVAPLTATIIRTNQNIEKFAAILILKFDNDQKIILWQEVYVPL